MTKYLHEVDPILKNNPTAKFSRIFDLLSKRDPTLNATLYEDDEFASLMRDVYAALSKLNLGAQILERAAEIHKRHAND